MKYIHKPENDLKNPRQFGRNVVTNLLRLTVTGATWIILTPVIIKNLGLEEYAVAALALSIIRAVACIKDSLRTPLVRFHSISIHSEDPKAANICFNSGFFFSLGMILLVLIAAPFIVFFSATMFRLPQGLELQSGMVIAAGMIAGALPIFQNIFEATPFAYNRIDLVNVPRATKNIILLVGILITFALLEPKLWHITFWFLAAPSVSLATAFVIWKRYHQVHVALQDFSHSKLMEMLRMGGWIFLSQAGTLLLLHSTVFIVNSYLGPNVQGRFSAVRQCETLIRMGAMAMSTALIPILLGTFAQREYTDIAMMSARAQKWLGLAVSLPVGLLIGFGQPFLNAWLGESYRDLWLLMTVLVAHLPFTLALAPLISIQMTLNRLKWPSLVSLLAGLLGIALAISWVMTEPRFGLGVAFAVVVAIILKHMCFTTFYAARILNLKSSFFYRPLFWPLFATSLVALFSFGTSKFLVPKGWIELGFCALIPCGLYVICAYFFFLTPDDRRLMANMVAFAK